MSSISPTPRIAREIQSWQAPMEMSFTLAEDWEGRLWIVQSCPVGSWTWSLEQAASLPLGSRTQGALKKALALAHQMSRERVSIMQATADAEELPRLRSRRRASAPSSSRRLKETANF